MSLVGIARLLKRVGMSRKQSRSEDVLKTYDPAEAFGCSTNVALEQAPELSMTQINIQIFSNLEIAFRLKNCIYCCIKTSIRLKMDIGNQIEKVVIKN